MDLQDSWTTHDSQVLGSPHRSRHCLLMRPGSCSATSVHCLVPYWVTRRRMVASSSFVQGRFCEVQLTMAG